MHPTMPPLHRPPSARRHAPPRGLRAGACALAAALAGSAATATPVTLLLTDTQGRPLPDTVASLHPPEGRPRPATFAVRPAMGVEISQRDRQFTPQVTVVPVGTRVAFPNLDTVRHHVYSLSPARRFEIKLYVGRPEAPIEFTQPGVVVMGCNIHDDMVGWVVVVDTPWHGQSDRSGRLHLHDVPPGEWQVRLWHPALPPGQAPAEPLLAVGREPLQKALALPLPPPAGR